MSVIALKQPTQSRSKPLYGVNPTLYTPIFINRGAHNNHLATFSNRGRAYAHVHGHEHTTIYSVVHTCINIAAHSSFNRGSEAPHSTQVRSVTT